MSTIQVFLLGMMAAWTPSVMALAWFLWRAGPGDYQDERHGIRHQSDVEAFPAER
jgi:hypothetical protein